MGRFSLREARQAVRDGDPETALAHYLALAKSLPGKAPSLQHEVESCVADCLAIASENRARDVIRFAADLYPDSADIVNQWGHWLFNNGFVAEAAEQFVNAMTIEKKSTGSRAIRCAEHNLINLKTHLIDQWHFRMLNDSVRNKAYQSAIQQLVQTKVRDTASCRLLDIGSGCGLLSVMAAQSSDKCVVYSVEQDALMCGLCQRTLRANFVADRVSVIHKHSADVNICDISNEKVDIIVCELMDAGFFGEGIVRSLLDAKKRLASSNGTIIPYSAEIMVAIIECKSIAENYWRVVNSDDTKCVFIDANLAVEPYGSELLREVKGGYRLLTEPTVAFSIDLNSEVVLDAFLNGFTKDLSLEVVNNGQAHAIVCWFRVYLAPGIVLDSGPESGTCWEQAVFPLGRSVALNRNEKIRMDISVKDDWIQGKLREQAIINSVKCIPISQIRLLNDQISAAKFASSLAIVGRRRPILHALYICGSTPYLLPGIIESLSKATSITVFCVSMTENDSENFNKEEILQLFGKKTDAKVIVVFKETDLPKAPYDIVICQPVLQNGLLCGEQLQQMAICRVSQRISRVFPSELIVRGILIESESLVQSSCVRDEKSCGVQCLSETFAPFFVQMHEDIELATLDYKQLSGRQTLFSLSLDAVLDEDDSRIPKFLDQTGLIHMKVTETGRRTHGLVVWFEQRYIDRSTETAESILSTAADGCAFRVCAYLFQTKTDSNVSSNGQIVPIQYCLTNGLLSFDVIE